MEVQQKKGLVEIVVLAALNRMDSYGYQLIRELEDVVVLTESTLYPILKRLTESGLVSCYQQEYCGRLRKYYHITEQGKMRLQQQCKDLDELMKLYRFIKECTNGSN